MLADRRAARWLNGLCATVGLAAIGSIAAIALMRKELSDGAIRPKESPIRQELREARRIAILGEKEGNGKEAQRAYERILSIKPNQKDAELGLARTLAAYGKRREAWDMYRRLGIDKRVDLEPEAAAWYADLAREFGTPQEADRAARSVIRWTPEKGWPKGKRLFAWAHLVAIDSSPNIEVALRHAERALTFDPSLPSVHLTISLLLGRPDQVKESREAFAKAMSLVKSGPWEGWIALAWYWQRKERPQEVLSALQEAFRRVPATDVRAWLRLRRAARTLNSGVLDMRRESPALRRLEAKAFERALQVVQAIDGEALVWLAEAVDKKEDAPKAFALAMAARRVTAPTQTRRYVRIAQSFIRWKRKAEAAEMLRAALNVTSPQDTGSYRDIAWGYRSLGDETKAIRMLREALRYAKSADQTRIETDLATLEGRWGGLGGSIGFNPSVLDLTVGPVGFR